MSIEKKLIDNLGRVRVFVVLELREHRRAGWTRENVVGKVFPCEDQGVVESRLLWPAELQHGFNAVVAHQVSRDRRHRRTVGRQVRALYQSHKQSTSVDGYVYMRR